MDIQTQYIRICIIICFSLISCKKDNSDSIDQNFVYLKGTWIDKESMAMHFIDFYSENYARFGLYGRNFESYDTFSYRITDSNQIAFKFINDSASFETLHNLIKKGNDTIEISDLTDIPENPNKTFIRRNIVTERLNDTIILGTRQEYFDFEKNYRLQFDSVLNDSRCPLNSVCIWEGYALVSIRLIMEGNYEYLFILSTYNYIKTDTLINNINFKLVGLTPLPEMGKAIEQSDYSVKIIAN